MKYIELLASYVPTNIVNTLLEDEKLDMPPQRKHYYAACLFADVSGFTALNEQMTIDYGPDAGAEKVAKHLNSYFAQMVKIFGSEGGDVFKFAGDAMIVLWATNSKEGVGKSSESLESCTRRAAQCAVRLMNVLGHKKKIADNVTLSVKIGVGAGEMAILRIGKDSIGLVASCRLKRLDVHAVKSDMGPVPTDFH